MTGLITRLKAHVLGPPNCPRCGTKKGDDMWDCEEEGQCDFNMHYGTHTDRFDDPWKTKEDILLAAELLDRQRLALKLVVDSLDGRVHSKDALAAIAAAKELYSKGTI